MLALTQSSALLLLHEQGTALQVNNNNTVAELTFAGSAPERTLVLHQPAAQSATVVVSSSLQFIL